MAKEWFDEETPGQSDGYLEYYYPELCEPCEEDINEEK